jgi:hypothetical protein
MLTYLRYALATFCFAASVGGLALWWRSSTYWDRVGISLNGNTQLHISTFFGRCRLDFMPPAISRLWHRSVAIDSEFEKNFAQPPAFRGTRWREVPKLIWFPLWYASLIFALAGVAALRLGRRFTLRSAIIATTVVAVLLGMAVGL